MTRTVTAAPKPQIPVPIVGPRVRTRTAKPGIPHVRSLDGLRGVAVLAVVLFHFTPHFAPGGFLGVDVFFVLSGFLITSLLVAERGRRHRIDVPKFWIRRARRLLPALVLVLLAVGVYALAFASPIEATRVRGDGFASLFYFANWRFIVSGQSYIEQFLGVAPSPLRHTWSLAIEEQFYLVWPLLVAGVGAIAAAFAWRRADRTARVLRRWLVGGCILAAIASATLMAVIFKPGGDPSRVYYGTDTRVQLLLLGAALGALTAGVVTVAGSARRRLLQAAGYVATIVLAVLLFTVHDTSTWLYEGGYALVGTLVVIVIAAAAQPGRNNQLRRLLATRPIVGLGLISYGVYLWHWPVTVWVTKAGTGMSGPALFAVRASLTLAVSVLSYFLVEMPIRRGTLHRRGRSIPWLLTSAAVASCAALLLVAPLVNATTTPSVAAPSRQAAAVASAYATAPRCDSSTSGPAHASTHATIMIVGNSIANEMLPCLTKILAPRGYRVADLAHPGAAYCDWLPLIRSDLGTRSKRPDVALLFAEPVAVTSCMHGLTGSALDQKWLSDVRTTTNLFLQHGVRVVLVPSVPAALQRGEPEFAAEFRKIASEHPKRVSVYDAGFFVRDTSGMYQRSMPCLPGGEPGCVANGTVRVRMFIDGGVHFCTLEVYGGTATCPAENSAGERRVAAALATQILADPASATSRATAVG